LLAIQGPQKFLSDLAEFAEIGKLPKKSSEFGKLPKSANSATCRFSSIEFFLDTET